MSVEKISNTLLHLNKNTRLRIHVSFTERDRITKQSKLKKFHTIYEYNNKEYVSLDFGSFITLEIKDEEEWDRGKSILMNSRNMFQIIHGLEKALKNIYLPDTFYIDGDDESKIKIYKEISVERTVRLYNIGQYQNMVLVPAVVYEEMEDAEYEGLVVFLNSMVNSFNITVGALESLLYTLKKVDLFTYGYMMIDFYFNNIVNHIGPSYASHETSDYIRSSRTSMFEKRARENAAPEQTVSTLKKEGVSDKDFFGI